MNDSMGHLNCPQSIPILDHMVIQLLDMFGLEIFEFEAANFGCDVLSDMPFILHKGCRPQGIRGVFYDSKLPFLKHIHACYSIR